MNLIRTVTHPLQPSMTFHLPSSAFVVRHARTVRLPDGSVNVELHVEVPDGRLPDPFDHACTLLVGAHRIDQATITGGSYLGLVTYAGVDWHLYLEGKLYDHGSNPHTPATKETP